MKIIYVALLLSAISLSYSCKQASDSSNEAIEAAADSEDLSQEAEKVTSDADLPDGCKEDIVRFGKYLDEATVYMAKRAKGEKLSKAEEDEWEKKSMDMGKEFANSVAVHTDIRCAQALSELNMKFQKVMMEMAGEMMSRRKK